MSADLKTKILSHDVAVPRYTSYPTAPQFKDEFPRETLRGWMRAIPDTEAVSLYLHIPFCRKMCWYCGCHTKITQRYAPVEDYLHLLLREIDITADTIGKRLNVAHIHFGGGTPTLLLGPDMRQVFERLHKHFNILPTAEIAIEVDPRSVTADHIGVYKELGFNRASLGVQDFDDQVLKAVNRQQPFETVFHVTDALRNAGIKAINFDFIYGLPYQTVRTMQKAMDLALTMSPERFSIFGYAHVPWMKKHITQLDYDALPTPEQRYDLFEVAAQIVEGAGYQAIGIDHFAKPDDPMAIAACNGSLHRNFQGYTADPCATLIGFGASSIGQYAGGYTQNTPHNPVYQESILDSALPVAKGLVLTADDILRRSVIERLMCDLSVDLDALGAAHLLDGAMERLTPLVHDGLVSVSGNRVTALGNPRLVCRMAASAFDAYLPAAADQKRHAQAV